MSKHIERVAQQCVTVYAINGHIPEDKEFFKLLPKGIRTEANVASCREEFNRRKTLVDESRA